MFAIAVHVLTSVVRQMRGLFHRDTLESPSNVKYTIGKSLGSGSFGDVVLAKASGGGKCAIKKVVSSELEQERKVLELGNGCPYLVGLIEAFAIQDCTFLVMQYASGGTLKDRLQAKPLSIGKARMFAAEIAIGLKFLHENGIIYRDLKPDNVLIHKGHIQLADFGLAEIMDVNGMASTICGTPYYIAPEVLVDHSYTSKVDWWSLGVIVHEMVVGHKPFRGDDLKEVYRSILFYNIIFPPDLDHLDYETKHFIDGLLQKNPHMRFGWKEVQSHHFLGPVRKQGKRHVEM